MYHTNLDWCTPSVTPLQKRLMSALRRDLVVFDCQPPSNIWRKSSPTVAMWLPCRYTLDSSDSGQYVTLVLELLQFLLLATAAFISDSILRMKWCRLVDFYTIHEIGEGTTDAVPLPQLSTRRTPLLPSACQCRSHVLHCDLPTTRGNTLQFPE